MKHFVKYLPRCGNPLECNFNTDYVYENLSHVFLFRIKRGSKGEIEDRVRINEKLKKKKKIDQRIPINKEDWIKAIKLAKWIFYQTLESKLIEIKN